MSFNQLDIITVPTKSSPKLGQLMEYLKGIEHECRRTINKYGIAIVEMKIYDKWHIIYDWVWSPMNNLTYVYYFKEGSEE